MATKRLLSGSFDSSSKSKGETLEKECLLCYEGQFDSMDGPVEVTKEQLTNIAMNYNAKMAKSRSLNGGIARDKDCAPLQLDHSVESEKTVGRIYSDLTIKPVTLLDGRTVMGLFGTATVIGKENIEKAEDGRWANLSIGADFEKGEFNELTVTPFPAASEASFLSNGKIMKKRLSETELPGHVDEALWEKAKRASEKAVGSIKWPFVMWWYKEHGGRLGKEEMSKYSKHFAEYDIKFGKKKMSKGKRFSEENKTMNHKLRCLKHLMNTVGMSKEDAESHLKKMSEEQVQKMSAMLPMEEETKMHDKEEPSMEDRIKLAAEKAMSQFKAMMDEITSGKETEKELQTEQTGGVHIDIASHEGEGEGEKEMSEPEAGETEEHEKGESKEKEKSEHLSDDNDEDDKELSEEEDEHDKKLAESEDGGDELAADPDLEETGASLRQKHIKDLMKAGMGELEAHRKVALMSDEEIKAAIKGAIETHEAQMHPNAEFSEEKDEEDKELSEEDGEEEVKKDKMDDKEKPADRLKKLSAKNSAISKLSADFRKNQEAIKLSLKRAKISSRLSSLKASGLITPAEIKKLNTEELAKESDQVLDKMFRLMEAREPVIHAGIIGTAKGINVQKMSEAIKEAELNEMEARMVENMPTIKNARLANGKSNPPRTTTPAGALKRDDLEAMEKNLASLVEQGKLKEVKHLMSKVFDDVKHLSAGEQEESKQVSSRVNELETMLNQMTKNYESLLKIVNEL